MRARSWRGIGSVEAQGGGDDPLRSDTYTETASSNDTLANLGTLRPRAVVSEGRGADGRPATSGAKRNKYFER